MSIQPLSEEEVKEHYKECKSATVSVNGVEAIDPELTIGPNYVNLSWDGYKSHFSNSGFNAHTAPSVTGDRQITFRFRGSWDADGKDGQVDWPIVLDFADASEFGFATSAIVNHPQRSADPNRPVHIPCLAPGEHPPQNAVDNDD